MPASKVTLPVFKVTLGGTLPVMRVMGSIWFVNGLVRSRVFVFNAFKFCRRRPIRQLPFALVLLPVLVAVLPSTLTVLPFLVAAHHNFMAAVPAFTAVLPLLTSALP